jgi:hypothetical protein
MLKPASAQWIFAKEGEMIMNSNQRRIFFGAILVLMGLLFLVQTIFHLALGSLIVGSLFAFGGAAFLVVLFSDKQRNWWAAIPGIVLLGLGALVALPSVAGNTFAERWGGSLFLGSIGISFLVVYLINRSFWWAIIPTGTLLTIAAVAGFPNANGFDGGSIFFIGLGLTFGVLGLLPQTKGMKWPFIPAVILLLMGGLIALGSSSAMRFLFPVGLIAGGAYLLWLTFRPKEL